MSTLSGLPRIMLVSLLLLFFFSRGQFNRSEEYFAVKLWLQKTTFEFFDPTEFDEEDKGRFISVGIKKKIDKNQYLKWRRRFEERKEPLQLKENGGQMQRRRRSRLKGGK
ncbi:hypothetical protein RND81_07G102300 [Saponaria officinalis]|uniref:Uncharacterized protein n=2 Tax=Saponaria officinalis TaxID=3572 RepID=A0AAW1JPN3_SAPOF